MSKTVDTDQCIPAWQVFIIAVSGTSLMKDMRHRVLHVFLPPHGGEGLLGLSATPARGIVLFAHANGSSRLSPQNQIAAYALQEVGIATLLFDLLTERKAARRYNVFHISLLADRLSKAASWFETCSRTKTPAGLVWRRHRRRCGLVAAAEWKDMRAVVSRGGRADLADKVLPRITAPTLLIVGQNYPEVLAWNREAFDRLQCERRLEVVAGATGPFEEAFVLVTDVILACTWFLRHLTNGTLE